jgi:hypothetical protein
MAGGTVMKTRTFGDVVAEVDGGDSSVFLHARAVLSLRAAEELVENLREALAWIRDQKRRETEDQTPMLPL